MMDDGIRRAGLDAQAAAGTHRGLDAHEGQVDLAAAGLDLLAATRDVDGRTTDVEAVAAAGALVVD